MNRKKARNFCRNRSDLHRSGHGVFPRLRARVRDRRSVRRSVHRPCEILRGGYTTCSPQMPCSTPRAVPTLFLPHPPTIFLIKKDCSVQRLLADQAVKEDNKHKLYWYWVTYSITPKDKWAQITTRGPVATPVLLRPATNRTVNNYRSNITVGAATIMVVLSRYTYLNV